MSQAKLREMMQAVGDARRILVMTHDNPDPDAISSGWALSRVLQRLSRGRVTLAYGGIVGRTENRTMIRLLRIPLRPLTDRMLAKADAICLVDCQPGAGNVSLPKDRRPTVVLDHHPLRRTTMKVPFYDVRSDVGTTATLASEYLEEAAIRPDRRLATALFYAIRSETQNLGRESARDDVRHFSRLFPLVDNVALSRIEVAPISRGYFSMVDRAIDGTRIYGDRVAVTVLGSVDNPDMVSQFADLMIRLEGIGWALSLGRQAKSILLSIRTNRVGANAGRVIARIVGRDGSAGGHGMMAAGQVPVATGGDEAFIRLERNLQRRALEVLRVKGRKAVPLLRKRGED